MYRCVKPLQNAGLLCYSVRRVVRFSKLLLHNPVLFLMEQGRVKGKTGSVKISKIFHGIFFDFAP